jgi:outer membrane protein OmpA-like peptidoglycan-associated protein
VGWLHIIDATESTATAAIDFTCDAVAVGDHLEPYVEPLLPPGIDRTDATGKPDPSHSAQVLYGNDGRQMGGGRDFILASAGRRQGVMAGARYAVYRGASDPGVPPVPFGEGVVVSVFADKSLLRLTEARDAVFAGDTLVPRVGGDGFTADAEGGSQELPLSNQGGEGAPLAERPVDEDRNAKPRKFAFEDLSFDFDKYTLKKAAIAELDQAVDVLQKNPALHIHIEGYSCNLGSAKYNLALGEKRAKTARDYLLGRGVAASRLTTVSFGEEQPKYDNSQKDTRRLNRRAALVVKIEP